MSWEVIGEAMKWRKIFWQLFVLTLLQISLVDCLYFPMPIVKVSLPTSMIFVTPMVPLIKLRVLPELKKQNISQNVTYAIASETIPDYIILDGDSVKLNSKFIFAEKSVSQHQTFVVTATQPHSKDLANITLHLSLIEGQSDCENFKMNLCFWNLALFQINESDGSQQLAPMSSDIFRRACKDFTFEYSVIGGNGYVEMQKMKDESWFLSTTKKTKGSISRKIHFAVNCTISSSKGSENLLKDFDLTLFGREKLQIYNNNQYRQPTSNIIHPNERIATWIINDPGRKKLNLNVFLKNDTNNNFDLKCSAKEIVEVFRETPYYQCEITTKKIIQLKTPYTVAAEIEDLSLYAAHPNRISTHIINLEPINSNFEKTTPPSTKIEENFMLHLKYPDSVEISRKSVVGTRVAEPYTLANLSQIDVRKKVVEAKVQFQMLTRGAFNITTTGGIIFVTHRHLIKETSYSLKIIATHPNGQKFFYAIQVNVTETKPPGDGGVEICGKSLNDSVRISCSEKRSKSECVKTCGMSSGIIKRTNKSHPPVTIGCSWRSNESPQKLSKMYETCSPDLLTCPDRFCDSLEATFPKICPQDCTEYVFGSANKEKHLPGIASATGVCGCDSRQKCLCSLENTIESTPKQNERRKFKQIINETIMSRQREAISAEKAERTDSCGPMCFLFIIGGGIVLIFGTFAFLLMNYRRRVKKRCPNQEPTKDDMVIINYEEYVERQGDVIRPLAQTPTIKELPEYYDKKWEFPRYRLTIEETIGEGEFGKVLKARADGINGNTGSVTVAVKTLKENAKDSELADLISEYQLLKEIDHPNVIHLLGACTKLDGPVYIIIEYAKHGSLRNYLRRHRYISYEEINAKDDVTMHNQSVTPKDILTFAWQIAKGMNYLTDMKLVHRDLAARNVLVAEGLICKISDFGLTRDIYEDDTYLKRSKGRVPVKWMALESLADHIYTTKSDVWSYGIVLWELVTTGASPYPGIAGQNIFHLLKSGYRMERPPNCSAELYQILRSCWRENPSHRPTFKSLVVKFEEMLGEGKDYLDLNPRTVENKTYFSEILNNDDEPEIFAEDRGFQKDQNKFLNVKFEMFDKPVDYIKCQNEKCFSETKPIYENEKIMTKSRYENDGMEDTGYVLPSAQPKPV